MQRYRNTRFSRPGERKTVKPYGVEEGSFQGTIYYLSAIRKPIKGSHFRYGEPRFTFSPRVFWLHPTKGFRSQGART